MATLPVARASSVDDNAKREGTMSLTIVENKSDNQSDQKTIKVRIKMCYDNLSTKKMLKYTADLALMFRLLRHSRTGQQMVNWLVSLRLPQINLPQIFWR